MQRGRPEQAVTVGSGPVAAFASQLRDLRVLAGRPSYRELATRANYSSSALSEAARGRRLPSFEVTLAFVRACDGDEPTWASRWQECAEQLSALERRESDVVARDGWHGVRVDQPREVTPSGSGVGHTLRLLTGLSAVNLVVTLALLRRATRS
ncbi:MAG: helix-turn-helix transcriptional regulator [Ilumatobacter sp.]|uniref:helix-turn-helix domain-containing protein n=1 Tax=Ilumatobacter sp. TaxID=1967498 RepID=UPI003C765DA8